MPSCRPHNVNGGMGGGAFGRGARVPCRQAPRRRRWRSYPGDRGIGMSALPSSALWAVTSRSLAPAADWCRAEAALKLPGDLLRRGAPPSTGPQHARVVRGTGTAVPPAAVILSPIIPEPAGPVMARLPRRSGGHGNGEFQPLPGRVADAVLASISCRREHGAAVLRASGCGAGALLGRSCGRARPAQHDPDQPAVVLRQGSSAVRRRRSARRLRHGPRLEYLQIRSRSG
jgi:hypothetical protein